MLLCDKEKAAACITIIASWITTVHAFRLPQLPKEDQCQQLQQGGGPLYTIQGEAVVLKCPSPEFLNLNLAADHGFSLNWVYEKDKPDEGRVEAQDDLLWFLPALVTDSGDYVCILRNASYCIETTLSVKVYEGKSNNRENIAYPNMALSSVDKIICPDLDEFVKTTGTVELKWYKEFFPLSFVEGKHQYNRGDRFLLIRDLTAGDEGYYTCELTFPYKNTQYKVTRTIHLQITAAHTRPKIIDPLNSTIEAALGSRLIIPCRVFLGLRSKQYSYVTWLANNSYIDLPSERVKEEHDYLVEETDGNYVEIELTFNEVCEEDLSTEYKCVVCSGYGCHESTVQITLAAGQPIPRITYPLNSTIEAVEGSSLIVPCRVFTVIKSTATTEISWLANGIKIEDSQMSNRVSQGPQLVLREHEADYIEVKLVFNVVRDEDFGTEFKCVAKNSQGSHESSVQINLADSSSTCVIVGFFGTLSFLIVVCIFMSNFFKPRCKKDYVLTKS
ncbi:interleukin-1 receptor type 2-like [Acipenser ruthenus]|uniref:interleukin-1 receptor type 2-like n=1 Tax=Acipenser ruthenus TaxID=7906 RepID=UPI002741757F|nr:interleukin-1 receptor type 2-like [Acipenser ruthenus]